MARWAFDSFFKISTSVVSFLFIAFISLSAPLALSDINANSDDPFTLEEKIKASQLDELINIDITTGNKEKESLIKSASISTVITQKQLQQWGVTDLYQALSYLPGISLTESYWGYSTLNFQGVLQSHYNNKVLLLINGHPSFEKTNGSFHLEHIPINVIDRIEVVQGPGSALYGTNALAGVINVITKTPSDDQPNSVQANLGSMGYAKLGAVLGGENIIVAASATDDEGYEYQGTLDRDGNPVDLDYYNDIQNAFVTYQNKGWQIDVAAFNQHKQKLGIVPDVAYNGPNDYRGRYIDIAHTRTLNSGNFQARLRYDYFDRFAKIGQFPVMGFGGRADNETQLTSGSRLLGFNLQYQKNILDSLSAVTGLIVEEYKTDPYLFSYSADGSISPFSAFDEKHAATDNSVFGQLKWQVSERITWLAGGQFNKNTHIESTKWVPGLGGVFRIGDQNYLKLLYGKAYRNPDIFELHVHTNSVLWGSDDLQREEIETLNVVFDTLLFPKSTLRINMFTSHVENVITRRPAVINPNGNEYYNSPGQDIDGIQLDLNSVLLANLNLKFNLTYTKGDNQFDDSPIVGITENSANVLLHYQASQFVGLFVGVQYVGERSTSYRDLVGNSGNDMLPSYALSNLRLSYKRTEWEVALVGQNVFDRDFQHPDYISGTVRALPGGPNQRWIGTVDYTF